MRGPGNELATKALFHLAHPACHSTALICSYSVSYFFDSPLFLYIQTITELSRIFWGIVIGKKINRVEIFYLLIP